MYWRFEGTFRLHSHGKFPQWYSASRSIILHSWHSSPQRAYRPDTFFTLWLPLNVSRCNRDEQCKYVQKWMLRWRRVVWWKVCSILEDLTPRLSKITITLRLNESVIQIRTQSVWITGFLCWLRSRNSVSYFTKQRHLTFQVMCHVCALFRGLWPQMRLASERQSCGHTVLRMVRASNSDCMPNRH
jgi:hypothetical protein